MKKILQLGAFIILVSIMTTVVWGIMYCYNHSTVNESKTIGYIKE